MEFPQIFFVEVTDITGVLSNLTQRYNDINMDTLRLPITSNPIPNVCLPVQVELTATNDIGTTTLDVTLPSNYIESETDCLCYQTREQIASVNVSGVTSNSVTVALFCGHEESRFLFELSSNEQSQSFVLSCGNSNHLTDLLPDTEYLLYRRYTDEVQCEFENITTDIPSTSTTGTSTGTSNDNSNDRINIAAAVSIPISLIFLICVVIALAILAFCCLTRPSVTKNQDEGTYTSTEGINATYKPGGEGNVDIGGTADARNGNT